MTVRRSAKSVRVVSTIAATGEISVTAMTAARNSTIAATNVRVSLKRAHRVKA